MDVSSFTIEMKVEIMSKETIRPSTPTPHHLRTFNLSFLDQMAPPFSVPIILFYPVNENDRQTNIKECSHDLRRSLSKTLTSYYPLAGRIKDDVIECDGGGVSYSEAQVHNVNGGMYKLIQDSDVNVLKQFVPSDPYVYDSKFGQGTSSAALLSIRINVLEQEEDCCGGIVIGIRMSHKIGDASSLTTFINDWAATARGVPSDQIKGPRFDILPFLIPPRDLMGYILGRGITGEEIQTKNFLFDGSKIAELKKAYIMTGNNQYPNRVEAVSAFIWRCFINLRQTKKDGYSNGSSSARMYGVTHAVNMRTRMVPPLPSNTFGNMYISTVTLPVDVEAEGTENHQNPNLVREVREAIRKVDSIYVKITMLGFTSWYRFPIYEADFGWGKPLRVTPSVFPYKNVVVLMDTKSGDGIEAWVSMTKDDMAEFECDDELLHFVT
ncbi:hypothetical protein MKW94_029481 [Papaver nudicaule]|uniref:Uncharacterized protein n=1 Tax=Papaver nudicaule TaxID=74823 RepID=A0AA42B0U8_PAPNU|nr:hypothetical protein [Papaver nudicaule]